MAQARTQVGLADVASVLQDAKRVAVIGHLRPDADAIGAVTALVTVLRRRGIEARGFVGQTERFAENLYTIPGARDVAVGAHLMDADLYVCVDCGSLNRTGAFAEDLKEHSDRLIVIDHHASNEGFGRWNHVDAAAESTTVILYDLFAQLGEKIDTSVAHCLYAGLVTDTGSFRWGSPRMHVIAADLIDRGIDARQIATDLIDEVSAYDLAMIGSVLAGVRVLQIDGVTAAVLVADHETVVGHSASAVESLVDFVHSVTGTDLGVVFKATSARTWAVSLRSRVYDVSQVAARQGGGGHRPAAAYTTAGTRQEVIDELVAAVRDISPQAVGGTTR
ncbi:DHH family phosphoesterase [Corynebacterium uberis]|uniref:DHH family phosphoesterase n=1 Tax=Corynebacterium TaxID=1716 RepID=UPI001D09B41B|nr:bifunctional oligoribonuclease/PAP phosphatase NrnA [Corynebacterium uberis]MCZ9308453.1 bifunctional oligoribonuclease/PAP phosphatase NrnA [Corynebacterium sp. c6VSa_13]UDL74118.1 bifunctional oligoribonuclease/PAP phosphatase NrnA [Corynebacterium uberis]UDL74998.1 bifunctional oligoribonuclease/PAP phosphatase NrnA [Corynebacterium uberis]UDL77213.1 bifunctional oligoribonuclease/PAP phosphatase NrnA [Corynebacterium uberis]UDL79495.1 bifunctional oligoribonuclease/PAP phosphatase NrnA 